MKTLVVTRHDALVDFLLQEGLIPYDYERLEHVEEEDIRGRVVVGVLPMHLAAAASMVYVVDLDIPKEKRGMELTTEEVRMYFRGLNCYVTKKVSS